MAFTDTFLISNRFLVMKSFFNHHLASLTSNSRATGQAAVPSERGKSRWRDGVTARRVCEGPTPPKNQPLLPLAAALTLRRPCGTHRGRGWVTRPPSTATAPPWWRPAGPDSPQRIPSGTHITGTIRWSAARSRTPHIYPRPIAVVGQGHVGPAR